jgi:hypothetical protein
VTAVTAATDDGAATSAVAAVRNLAMSMLPLVASGVVAHRPRKPDRKDTTALSRENLATVKSGDIVVSSLRWS